MDTRALCLIGALGLLSLAPAKALAVLDCELNGEPISLNNGNTTAGKSGLVRCRHRDTGKLQREQEMRDGAVQGVVRFYDQGVLSKEHHVNRKGNHHGLAREFNARGITIREATYDDGSTVGIVRRWDDEGRLVRVSFHEDGRERSVAELNPDGRLRSLRCAARPVLTPHVQDTTLCGFAGKPATVAFYNAKGKLIGRTTFASGQITRTERIDPDSGKATYVMVEAGGKRTETRYTGAGTKVRREVSAADGGRRYPVSLQQYDASGNLARTVKYCETKQRGRPLREREFYMNGQPRRDHIYYYEVPETLVRREYSDQGTLLSEGRYLLQRHRRVPQGRHRGYDPQGRLRTEHTYNDQGQLQRVRTLSESGAIERDDAVFPDGSRRAYSAP